MPGLRYTVIKITVSKKWLFPSSDKIVVGTKTVKDKSALHFGKVLPLFPNEWLNNLPQKCHEIGQVNQQNRRHDQNYIPEN